MLATIGRRLEERYLKESLWTDVYGISRSLIAFSTLLTLACNRREILFRPIAGVAGAAPFCSEKLQRMGIFCIAGSHLELARWVAVASLAIVVSGWRPRVTGILHWWIAASFELSASTLEGGDQAAGNLALILIPVTLCDSRRWHWCSSDIPYDFTRLAAVKKVVVLASIVVARVQVSAIYFHAAVGKLKVTEWQNGTAMYYWLAHPVFGVNPAWRRVITRSMESPTLVSAVTWGTIILELFLCMGLVATRRVRRILLFLGILFHLGILLCMGLFTFAITMWGALVAYLRPWNEPFQLARLPGRIRETTSCKQSFAMRSRDPPDLTPLR